MKSELPLQQISPNIEKGAFRKYVYNKYGKKGFTSNGNIESWVIREAQNSTNRHVRKMANLARTYKRISIENKEFKI